MPITPKPRLHLSLNRLEQYLSECKDRAEKLPRKSRDQMRMEFKTPELLDQTLNSMGQRR